MMYFSYDIYVIKLILIDMVEERAENAVTHKYAMTIWVGIQQRKALRTWSRFVRIRRMFVTGRLCVIYIIYIDRYIHIYSILCIYKSSCNILQ